MNRCYYTIYKSIINTNKLKYLKKSNDNYTTMRI